jgi:serine/threonine-protein kinase
MSPEQASGDKNIDGRSDTFALGCVLYEMLSGEPPFIGPNPQATLMRRFKGPPRPLRPMISIPEHVETAILRSLARDPGERFATPAEFADALAGKAAPPAAPAAAPGKPEPASAAAGKRGCAAVLVAGVGLGSAAVWLLRLL